MGKRGPKPLPIEEKKRRGTYRPGEERRRAERDAIRIFGVVVRDPDRPPEPLVPPRAYGAILEAYLAGVGSGALVACSLVRKAVERQRRDVLRASEDETWPYVWDQAQADAACHFIEQLPHVEGSDWASPLIVLEPWQVFVVSCLFGWRLRAKPKYRRFTTLYLEIARKSGKSTLMAAIAYYHLLKEGELGASVICGATTGQQARMVFGIMQKQGRMSRWLREHRVEVYSNSIVAGSGEAKPVNAKASTQDGLNPSMIVLDESHAQGFALCDVLQSAQGARPNPLFVCPTTAGYNLLSVGYAMHQQVEKILDGIFVNEAIFGVVYTLDPDDDWRDPRVWPKANPMLGIAPSLESVEQACLNAIQIPAKEGEFRVKVCSQWMQSAFRWISSTALERCVDSSLRLEDFAGHKCWIGADLAALDDIAAVALLFERGDEIVAFVKCYLPEGVVAARVQRVPYYQVWVDDGILQTTDQTMIDYAAIEEDIRGWCRLFTVQAIVFDQWNSNQICGNLHNARFPARIMEKNPKKFTPPAMDFEARVNHGKFRYDGNGLMTWAILNAVVTRRVDGSLLPKKESADSPNKIDPLDAVLQAMAARLEGLKPAPQHQLLILGGRRA